MKSLAQVVCSSFGSSVGKKLLVAVTGLALLLFLAGHLAGNLLIYRGPEELNAYAHELHTALHGSLVWIARAGLLIALVVHVALTISLARDNRKARPKAYAKPSTVQASPASRSMILSGLVILSFVVYHLLHFTVHVVEPGYDKLQYDLHGHTVPDVYHKVVAGFSSLPVSGFYILSMALLCTHLSHGFASVFQTLGLRSARTASLLKILGGAYALVIFVGNVSIPISVLAGVIKPILH
jgi:succinate dehydrogenase / fumarate reductase cytochrome b subunit